MPLRAVAFGANGGSGNSAFASSAFASLPAAASSAGLIYSVSDAGSALFRSNGTIWKPTSGVALLAASAVAVSGAADTAENTLASITIPAGIMSANGSLRIFATWSYTNGADDKITRIRFSGGAGGTFFSFTNTTTAAIQGQVVISNRNATNSQLGFAVSVSAFGTTGGALVTTAIDTTAATSVAITVQKETGADTLTLERYLVELLVP